MTGAEGIGFAALFGGLAGFVLAVRTFRAPREGVGPWEQSAMCRECLDGFHCPWTTWRPPEERGTDPLVCRACGGHGWKKATGRKIVVTRGFRRIVRWEWRTEDYL